MDYFYTEWLAALEQDGVIAVATVVNGIGATPRENGAQMLIRNSGRIFDTVGGGKLEGGVMQRAKHVLADGRSEMFHFDLTGEDVAQTEMICGGEGDVFIYYSDSKDINTLHQISRLKNYNGWMCYPIDEQGGICYICEDGVLVGDEDQTKCLSQMQKEKGIFIGKAQGRRYLVQWVEMSGKLHIMGAGHVSMEIAMVAHIAGIDCCVYDDRADFLTEERFAFAARIVLDDMKKLPDIEVGSKDMIAIVTRGHLYDLECLEWAIGKHVGYIGMIGSKRKTNMIFESLLAKGILQERISKVYAPIGLDIGAQTPAEIAVAIVAQLIAFKRA